LFAGIANAMVPEAYPPDCSFWWAIHTLNSTSSGHVGCNRDSYSAIDPIAFEAPSAEN
jgi:hypothetical protein